MNITLKKIAELAEVSRGTVDKVIHNRPGVGDETRKRVNSLLAMHNYEPYKAGRLLANHKKEIKAAALIVVDREDEYFQMVKNGMEMAYRELKQNSFFLKYEMIARNDENIIIQSLTSLGEENINAIILPPYNSEKVSALIGELTAKGINIITYSTDIKNRGRLFFVGNDYYKSGAVAASLMAKMLNGSGEVILFEGDKGVKCHEDRKEGFINFISTNCPDIRIIGQHESIKSPLEIYFYTREIIKKHPSINGIFIVSRGVEGIVAAIKGNEWDMRPKIVTFDIYADTEKYLKSGDIDFVVDQNPTAQGKIIINTLYEYLFYGKAIENDNIYTPMAIYIKENI